MLRSLQVGLGAIAALSSVMLANTIHAQSKFKGNLTIEVGGLQNQKGFLCIRLFTESKGFPEGDGKSTKRECVKITEEPIRFSFKNLTAGSYAVAAFHDANGDRKLNRNAAGMPTEGYGFSNNPAIKTGPPKFGQTVFLVAGPNTGVKIQMKYGI
ncbi:MAG: DUF2141 domain-containing protein [Leptolyngbyaceae cyanobacterium CAN_BIN12]|nr:DUF2141 domain-containing protein [Leptolyngbyaceae cyanobacterium CAN_BIN12]